tara:strand:+ start:841 stop:1314 length:474 start_codon:yes stop_codon:yes gene_type:complete
MDDINNHLSLRKVIYTDESLLFNWANDPDVRKWSFSKNIISLDEHKIWFNKKLNDSNVLMLIFEVNNTPTGMVRLEKENGEVVLNYLIASQSRGKGLASRMLKMAMNEVENHWQSFKVLAYTLPGNIASTKSLEKAGFLLSETDTRKNFLVYNFADQ